VVKRGKVGRVEGVCD